MTAVQEYLKQVSATPAQKAEFERIDKIVRQLAPEGEWEISYGIPTFKLKGKYLIYFNATKNHMAVYPTLGKVEPSKGAKGTFRFTEKDPVPEWVVKEIVTQRLAQITK